MFFREYNGWPQEDSATQLLKCQKCGNTSEHYVYVVPHGIQLAIAFMSKPLAGMKKYHLACPACDNLTKEITKEQAAVMRNKP